jgi:hypothetical protein
LEKKGNSMKLTKEEAVRLHIEMWTAMKKALGDRPKPIDRKNFKEKWCKEHFPDDDIMSFCFLCEYDYQCENDCKYCPIAWPGGDCNGKVSYLFSPISEILALPVRADV